MSNIGSAARSGSKWFGIASVFNQASNLVLLVILTRLMSPEDFGIFAMVDVVMIFARLILEGGLGNSLIQKQSADQVVESTVFFLNIIFGLGLTLLTIAGAGWFAEFYDRPELVLLMWVMSWTLLIHSLTLVQRSLLSRQLQFKSQALISILGTLISGSVAIVMALNHYGYWSLAGKQIVRGLVDIISLWLISNWRPTIVFDWKSTRKLFDYGYKLTIATVLMSAYRNIQTFIIGKFFTATDLGFYTRSNEIASAPGKLISETLNRVVFPVLSAIQSERDRLSKAIRKSVKIIALISFPCSLGVGVISPVLIPFLFTEKWSGSVIYIQTLAVIAALNPMIRIQISAIKALGRSDIVMKYALLMVIMSLCGVGIGIPFGIFGIIISQVIAHLIYYLLYMRLISNHTGYSMILQALDIAGILLLSLLMGAVIYIFQHIEFSAVIIQLLVQVVVGVLCYLIMVRLFFYAEFKEINKLVGR